MKLIIIDLNPSINPLNCGQLKTLFNLSQYQSVSISDMTTNGCSGVHRRGCSQENRHSRTAQCRTACRCGHMVWSSHTRSLHPAPTPLYTHITHVTHYTLVSLHYTHTSHIKSWSHTATHSSYQCLPFVHVSIPIPQLIYLFLVHHPLP